MMTTEFTKLRHAAKQTALEVVYANEQVRQNNLLEKVTPVGIYLLKVNNEHSRTICETYSKLTVKTSEQHRASLLLTWDRPHTLLFFFVLFFYNKTFTHKPKKITTITRYITNFCTWENQKLILSKMLKNI